MFAPQASPIDEGTQEYACSATWATIAQLAGRTLHCDPANGRIVGDEEAMKHWNRTYEPGWELSV